MVSTVWSVSCSTHSAPPPPRPTCRMESAPLHVLVACVALYSGAGRPTDRPTEPSPGAAMQPVGANRYLSPYQSRLPLAADQRRCANVSSEPITIQIDNRTRRPPVASSSRRTSLCRTYYRVCFGGCLKTVIRIGAGIFFWQRFLPSPHFIPCPLFTFCFLLLCSTLSFKIRAFVHAIHFFLPAGLPELIPVVESTCRPLVSIFVQATTFCSTSLPIGKHWPIRGAFLAFLLCLFK